MRISIFSNSEMGLFILFSVISSAPFQAKEVISSQRIEFLACILEFVVAFIQLHDQQRGWSVGMWDIVSGNQSMLMG
jgi:hypothetical protein